MKEKETLIKVLSILIPKNFPYIKKVTEIDLESTFIWHFRFTLNEQFVKQNASTNYLKWLKRTRGGLIYGRELRKELGEEVNVKKLTDFITNVSSMVGINRTAAYNIKFYY